MKYTNNLNLPRPIVDAIKAFDAKYDKGDADFSVTELIRPPYMNRLNRDHWDDLVEDVADNIFRLFGQAVHMILENATGDDYLPEARLFMAVDKWTISGQIDVCHIDTGLIQDYKVTSVWACADGPKVDWVQQVNALALLFFKNGGIPKKLQVAAILRDHSKTKARRGQYPFPLQPVKMLDVKMADMSVVYPYLVERCTLQTQALEAKSINDVPPCTSEEMWERPTIYAIMKEGRKSSVKNHDNEDDAQQHMDRLIAEHASKKKKGKAPKLSIQVRPGERIRCMDYCAVAPFCPQWQAFNGSGESS
jgi:hypothetical protein